MSVGSDITLTPAPGEPDAWGRRRLAILAQLAEAGLEIALALKARIVETAAMEPEAGSAGNACADLTRAFDRASRSVRLCITLRDRVMKDAPLGVPTAQTAAREARARRAGQVQRIIQRIARQRYEACPMRDALERQSHERLYDPDITGDLLDRPIGALVARICADLGLSPDWRTMAEEAWAQAEIAERPAGSPYAAWPDLPAEAPDPEDPDDDFANEDERDDPGGGDARDDAEPHPPPRSKFSSP